MQTFIDLEGASGRSYRFRLWEDEAQHQPAAGNYAVVRQGEEGAQVIGIGATNDLSRARTTLAGLKRRGGEAVYIRLNVPRTTRETEHEDLVAHYKPQFVADDD